MSGRILRIELRRSVAPWGGLLLTVAGLGLLLITMSDWVGRWMILAVNQREDMFVLAPVALALGAWLGRRERGSGLDELIATTPLVRWRRLLPPAVAAALAVVVGYLLPVLVGLAWVVPLATYHPPAWTATVAVGALAMVAMVLFGAAVGRLLPYQLTPPLLAVGGVVVLVVAPLQVPGRSRVPLLSPFLTRPFDEFTTVAGRANLGQAVWFTALVLTGFVLFGWVGRRAWSGALALVLAGLAAALPVLPRADRTTVADRGAGTLVCTAEPPRVCVTRVHERFLPAVTAPARQALAALSRLPDPPVRAAERAAPWWQTVRNAPTDTLPLYLPIDRTGRLDHRSTQAMLRAFLDGAGTLYCGGFDERAYHRNTVARRVVGEWLGATYPDDGSSDPALVDRARAGLLALPPEDQVARVAAVRTASLACDDDLLAVLSGGTL